MRRTIVAALAAALLFAPAAPALADTTTKARVIRVIDGDTVVTTKGTVRLIGIDTPERGKCGWESATSKAEHLAPRGAIVRLRHPSGGTDNKDRYGRILRYINYNGTDFGGAQIRAGFAKARYDSRDGYSRHPKQSDYIRWDKAKRDVCGGSAWADLPETGDSGGGTATVTDGAWNQPGPDLDCGDIPKQYKPVRITGTDYHRLDADADGWGCDT